MATKGHKNTQGLLICFYGDDFTGSTDALESLSRAGIRTVLFTSPPSVAQLAEYPGLQAAGVAGMTRSMGVGAMRAELRPVLCALKGLKPRHVHYKVCSTFDSSPAVGSIGAVIDLAWEIFKPRFVPLLVGAPALGRHCVFGNLFARAGTGSQPIRLDRHPTMSKHPSTPMDESDLRIHLGRQTKKSIALFDLLKVGLPGPDARAALDQILRRKAEVVLFDALFEDQLERIGQLIDSSANGKTPLFSTGSSGIGMALAQHWTRVRKIRPVKKWPAAGKSAPLLVMSGSCSPVTAAQIEWAIRNGFAEVALDTVGLASRTSGATIEGKVAENIVKYLQAGRSVVVHSSRGPDDGRIQRTKMALEERGGHVASMASGEWTLKRREHCTPMPGDVLGSALGRILREALRRVKLRRVCLAGGDTSSYAARTLGVESMEMIGVMAPGAPLCRVRAPGSPADGLEMNFKGGQVGGVEYFGSVRNGQCE